MKIEFVPYDEKFLKLSWFWLNDPEVKVLSNTPDFSIEEQQMWFNNLKTNKQYRIWGIEAESKPIGAAGLKRITKTNACIFWYIGDKNFWGKGIGTFIASEITDKAKELELDYLYGEPLVENFRSINLLFKEGYKITNYEIGFYTVKKTL